MLLTTNIKTDWLIIFFVLDTTDINLDNFRKQLLKIKLNKATSIYILKDTIHRINEVSRFPNSKLEIFKYEHSDSTNRTEEIVPNLAEVDKKQAMAYLKAIKAIYKLHKPLFKIFITWSHGSGIAISNTNPPSVSYIPSQLPNASDGEMPIFISELTTNISDIIDNDKFDIVIMCNCYMNLLDSCYNAQKITNYYIAAATYIQMDNGFSFIGLITALGAVKKARKIKYDYYKNYMNYISYKALLGYYKSNSNINENPIITSTRLNEIKSISLCLKKICDYFISNKDKLFPIIYEACDLKLAINEVFWDAIALFKRINKKSNCRYFDKLIKEFELTLFKRVFVNKIVINNKKIAKTKTFKNIYSLYLPILKVKTPEGIFVERDVSFKVKKEYWATDEEQYSLFLKETNWNNFVKFFYDWQK